MANKEDSKKVFKRLNKHIRPASHSRGYYLALFLLLFAIPLYVFLKFFYLYVNGWHFYDLLFILALLIIAIYSLYKDAASKRKLPVWFTVLGIISGVLVAALLFYVR